MGSTQWLSLSWQGRVHAPRAEPKGSCLETANSHATAEACPRQLTFAGRVSIRTVTGPQLPFLQLASSMPGVLPRSQPQAAPPAVVQAARVVLEGELSSCPSTDAPILFHAYGKPLLPLHCCMG